MAINRHIDRVRGFDPQKEYRKTWGPSTPDRPLVERNETGTGYFVFTAKKNGHGWVNSGRHDTPQEAYEDWKDRFSKWV